MIVGPLSPIHSRLEGADAMQRGAPVGDGGELIDKPAQRGLHLVEGADHHHQPAQRQRTAEIAGRGDQRRHDDGEPAIARSDPGQPRHGTGQFAHGGDDAVDVALELTALVALAVIERDALGTFADADEREAQFRFARIELGVEADQRQADAPGQQRADQRVDDRAPDHVAGN